MAFFRILLIFILIWIGIRFLFRFLLSWLFANKINEQQKHQAKEEEGKVTILKDKNQKKHHRKEEGEYVDYEEI